MRIHKNKYLLCHIKILNDHWLFHYIFPLFSNHDTWEKKKSHHNFYCSLLIIPFCTSHNSLLGHLQKLNYSRFKQFFVFVFMQDRQKKNRSSFALPLDIQISEQCLHISLKESWLLLLQYKLQRDWSVFATTYMYVGLCMGDLY